jgi:hypothetical protein
MNNKKTSTSITEAEVIFRGPTLFTKITPSNSLLDIINYLNAITGIPANFSYNY